MKGSQAKAHSGSFGPTQGYSLGKITEARDGVPTAVEVDGQILAVAGMVTPGPGVHLRFHTGAPVLVAHTEAGVLIQGAVQLADESARVEIGLDENERLVIHAKSGIVLKSDEATIEVLEDGKIRVSGNRIFSVSKGPMTLRGKVIELN